MDINQEQQVFNTACELFKKNSLKKSFILFEEVTSLNPKNFEAYFYMGNIFHIQGQLGKAIKAFNKVIELDPNHTDAAISLSVILNDIGRYETLLREGFGVIGDALAKIDQVFVDTKFEFGYVKDAAGNDKLIYMDEVGTPDSSRIWDGGQYRQGKVVENSKEAFRQLLLNHFPDSDILLNKDRMAERTALARDNALPEEVLMAVSATYVGMAEKIMGRALPQSDNPQAEIIDVLNDRYGLIA